MENKLRVLIVTGGSSVDENLLRSQYEGNDYVIAADGGIKNLIRCRLKPDLIVGDFDSAPKVEWLNLFAEVPVVTFPAEKDYTDTELAILEALKLSCKHISILGGTGTRLDHTLANMMLLQRIHDEGSVGTIIDHHNEITLIVEGEHQVEKRDWSYFSLIPLTDRIIVTLEGFKYPLDQADISQKSTIAISNEWHGEVGTVKLLSGKALLIRSRD